MAIKIDGNDDGDGQKKIMISGSYSRVRKFSNTLTSRYGENCESNCKKGDKDYFWCWTGWHIDEVVLMMMLVMVMTMMLVTLMTLMMPVLDRMAYRRGGDFIS